MHDHGHFAFPSYVTSVKTNQTIIGLLWFFLSDILFVLQIMSEILHAELIILYYGHSHWNFNLLLDQRRIPEGIFTDNDPGFLQ